MRLKWSIAVGGTHGKTTTTSLIAAGARRRRPRSDGGQRRHHQRLGLQRPARLRRLDGGRGRRIRRHHGQAAGDDRGDHQHRSRAPRPLRHLRGAARGLRHLRRQHPVLRRRRAVHRSSRGAGRSCRGCSTGASSPTASARRPTCAASTCTPTARACGSRRVVSDRKTGASRTVPELFLPMFGRHNVQNALAALAVAGAVGIDDAVVARAFASFGGVKRRFTRCGEVDGITVIDDYGHHPVEIAAVLAAARTVGAGPGHRRRPAAPLHPAGQPVRRVLLLLQRRRRGDRRRRLCRRRGPDRGHQPRRAGRWAARARPPPGDPARRPGRSGADRLRPRPPATSSSASAPATSPSGRTRCPARSPSGGGAARERRHDAGAQTPPRLIERLPAVARPLQRGRGAGADHLVPRRRSGRGDVPPGRRTTISRHFSRRSRRTCR